MLNGIFLLLGVGGVLVSLFVPADAAIKYAVAGVFAVIGLIGFGLIVRDWWGRNPPPKFNITITGLNIGHGFPENQQKARYLVWATIDNNGGPSIAKNWALTITTPTNRQIKGHRLAINVDSRVDMPNGPPRILSPVRALSVQGGNQDIVGSIDGYEMFDVTPISRDESGNSKTLITLSAQDNSGKSFSLSTYIGDIEGPRIEGNTRTSP
jgi:hypothetical protein